MSTKQSHNCDFNILDNNPVHNFTHQITDQMDMSRPLLQLYKEFSDDEKKEIREGLVFAAKKYNEILGTQLDFICFFDNQVKQPVDLYQDAQDSLAMASQRLANITMANTMLDRWDSNAVYVWADADKIIAKTRFLKTATDKKKNKSKR